MDREPVTQDDGEKPAVLYEKLRVELIEHDNLSDENRLIFYQLHEQVDGPDENVLNNLFIELRRQKSFNPRYVLTEEERRAIFKLLESKRIRQGLNRFDYRYYCFIAWKYNLTTEAELPSIPKIIEVSLDEFEKEFGINGKREMLLSVLRQALKKCGELYQLPELNILIGGSFVDRDKESPGDIDLLLLLDAFSYAKDVVGIKSDTIMRSFKDKDDSDLIDIVKLPVPLNFNHYMVYELLTLLGNEPKVKAKSKERSELKTNQFRPRVVYKLNINVSTI